MSANLTNMPLIPEFARVFFTAENDYSVSGLSVHPMRQFSAPTREVSELLRVIYAEGTRLFEEDLAERAVKYINHAFNEGIGKMDAEGKVRYAESTVNQYHELQNAFEGMVCVRTADGYNVYNPAKIPPSPTGELH